VAGGTCRVAVLLTKLILHATAPVEVTRLQMHLERHAPGTQYQCDNDKRACCGFDSQGSFVKLLTSETYPARYFG